MLLPKDVMMEAMRWFRAIAAAQHDAGDKENAAKNLKIAADIAIKLAPYCHPQLSARIELVKKASKSRPRSRRR